MPELDTHGLPATKPAARTRRPRLRFSLRTLAIFALTAGSGMLLWRHWQPWECVAALGPFEAKVDTVSFSPDGSRFVVFAPILEDRINLSTDKNLTTLSHGNGTWVFDTSKATEICRFPWCGTRESAPATDSIFTDGRPQFSTDGQRLICKVFFTCACVLDVPSGCTLTHHAMGLTPDDWVHISRDGSRLIACSHGGATVWDLASRRPLRVLKTSLRFDSCELSDDGRLAVTECEDKSHFLIWEVDNELPPKEVEGSFSGFVQDNSKLINFHRGERNYFSITDIKLGTASRRIPGDDYTGHFSPNPWSWRILDDRWFLVSQADSRTQLTTVFSLVDGGQLMQLNGLPIMTPAGFPIESRLVMCEETADGRRTLHLYDTNSWSVNSTFSLDKIEQADRPCYAFPSKSDRGMVIETREAQFSAIYADKHFEKVFHQLQVFPDRKRMIRFDRETAVIHDMDSGKVLHRLEQYADRIEMLDISRDGHSIVSASRKENFARLWHQRRPERWWGVFCLPELWLTAFLVAAFGWSLLHDRKRIERRGP